MRYHYRPEGGRDPICGAEATDGDYAIYHGYFLGLAQEYGPGEDLHLQETKSLCPDCLAHDDVILALLGEV